MTIRIYSFCWDYNILKPTKQNEIYLSKNNNLSKINVFWLSFILYFSSCLMVQNKDNIELVFAKSYILDCASIISGSFDAVLNFYPI